MLLPLVLVGCGNFTSKSFDISKSKLNQDIDGIPFTLNKPQFTVTRTPGASGGPDSYQVTVAYVPDSDQRYVLKMSPLWTASIDWTVSTDENGSFADTNGKAVDQTVPILTSLAKLAGAVAAADSYETPEDTQLIAIDTALTNNFTNPTPKIFVERTRICEVATPNDVAVLKSRWELLHPHLSILATENRMASFTYLDLTDRVLLETALCLVQPPPGTVPSTVQSTLNDPTLDPSVKALAQQIKDKFLTFDRSGLVSLKADMVKQRNLLYAQLTTKPPDSSETVLKDNAKVLKMLTQAISLTTKPPRGLLLDLTDLSISQWQSRRITELNNKIQARQFADRANAMPGPENRPVNDYEAYDQELTQLQLQKAAILGLIPAYRQIIALNAIPVSDPRYKNAQAELPLLQKQLADAESALTPAKSMSKADDPAVAAFLTAGDKPITSEWIVGRLGKKEVYPYYVIVLEPVAQISHGQARADESKSQTTEKSSVPSATPPPPIKGRP